jgi:large subunit ribosomal protein L19
MIKNKYLVDLQNKYLKNNSLNLNVGDTIKIGVKILEGNKERIQSYTGIIIVKRNCSVNSTIVVRKVFQGVGIERIFLINSPKICSIEVLKSSKVRRSKLYYLRYLSEKASRLKTL